MNATLVSLNLNAEQEVESVTWLDLQEAGRQWFSVKRHHYVVGDEGDMASLGTILFALHPHIDNTTAIVLNDDQRNLLIDVLGSATLFVPPIYTTKETLPTFVVDQLIMELQNDSQQLAS